MNTSTLIFVYNANSGIFNAVLDSLHKTFSPKTYDCNLCAITYTSFSMKKKWRDFISKLNVPVLFLHRDEIEKEYGITDLQLPVLLTTKGTQLDVLLSAERINAIKHIEDLIELVKQKTD
jgi:hypothetical protein